jgi:hypothetical protein
VPGEITFAALMCSAILRLGLGAGLAIALGQASQIGGGVGAIAVGMFAPLILESLGKQFAQTEIEPPRRISPTRRIPEYPSFRRLPPRKADIDLGRTYSSGRDGHVVRTTVRSGGFLAPALTFVREVGYGLTRSTPEFGGTEMLADQYFSRN